MNDGYLLSRRATLVALSGVLLGMLLAALVVAGGVLGFDLIMRMQAVITVVTGFITCGGAADRVRPPGAELPTTRATD